MQPLLIRSFVGLLYQLVLYVSRCSPDSLSASFILKNRYIIIVQMDRGSSGEHREEVVQHRPGKSQDTLPDFEETSSIQFDHLFEKEQFQSNGKNMTIDESEGKK